MVYNIRFCCVSLELLPTISAHLTQLHIIQKENNRKNHNQLLKAPTKKNANKQQNFVIQFGTETQTI